MARDDLASIRRLGILGGTFDPIHLGHLAIAEEVRGWQRLDAVLFIPAGDPPHKPHEQASAEHRARMVELAIADNPHFHLSRMELERPGVSYTVDTLRALRDRLPDTELFFILGADAAMEFFSWREPQAIMALAQVVAVSRPGFPEDALHRARAAGMLATLAPAVAISSTELRARARHGWSLRYLMPDPVAAYVREHGLYLDA
jgi:nicotinate-nucleotide adenylyltransferase